MFLRVNCFICHTTRALREGAIAVAVIGGLFLSSASVAKAESKIASEASFLPTWKLLSNSAKQQFIAGYLFGWRDAKKVTDIALDFVKENPGSAVNGLEKIRDVYDMEGLTAESVVRELDRFFSDSEGKEATLSQAMTAARQQMGR